MGATLGVELWAEWCYNTQQPFLWLYNLFVIVEYSLLSWYFISVVGGRWLKIGIICSVPIFALISILISVRLYGFNQFPGQNINLEGVLMLIVCTAVLFNLDTKLYSKIARHPDFWICCGWLIFFTGTFLSNGLLSFVMSQNLEFAKRVFLVLNHPLNLILYSCLIVGLICAVRGKLATN